MLPAFVSAGAQAAGKGADVLPPSQPAQVTDPIPDINYNKRVYVSGSLLLGNVRFVHGSEMARDLRNACYDK